MECLSMRASFACLAAHAKVAVGGVVGPDWVCGSRLRAGGGLTSGHSWLSDLISALRLDHDENIGRSCFPAHPRTFPLLARFFRLFRSAGCRPRFFDNGPRLLK